MQVCEIHTATKKRVKYNMPKKFFWTYKLLTVVFSLILLANLPLKAYGPWSSALSDYDRLVAQKARVIPGKNIETKSTVTNTWHNVKISSTSLGKPKTPIINRFFDKLSLLEGNKVRYSSNTRLYSVTYRCTKCSASKTGMRAEHVRYDSHGDWQNTPDLEATRWEDIREHIYGERFEGLAVLSLTGTCHPEEVVTRTWIPGRLEFDQTLSERLIAKLPERIEKLTGDYINSPFCLDPQKPESLEEWNKGFPQLLKQAQTRDSEGPVSRELREYHEQVVLTAHYGPSQGYPHQWNQITVSRYYDMGSMNAQISECRLCGSRYDPTGQSASMAYDYWCKQEPGSFIVDTTLGSALFKRMRPETQSLVRNFLVKDAESIKKWNLVYDSLKRDATKFK